MCGGGGVCVCEGRGHAHGGLLVGVAVATFLDGDSMHLGRVEVLATLAGAKTSARVGGVRRRAGVGVQRRPGAWGADVAAVARDHRARRHRPNRLVDRVPEKGDVGSVRDGLGAVEPETKTNQTKPNGIPARIKGSRISAAPTSVELGQRRS